MLVPSAIGFHIREIHVVGLAVHEQALSFFRNACRCTVLRLSPHELRVLHPYVQLGLVAGFLSKVREVDPVLQGACPVSVLS